jgi:predicted small metal-binding protein
MLDLTVTFMDGTTEEEVLDRAIDHAWKIHAIKPEEMTQK